MVLAPILLAVAGLGLFLVLRPAGSVLWVALLAFAGGSFLVINRGFIWLAMAYELAPAYVDAAAGDRSTIAAVGDTLIGVGFMAGLVTGVLIGGIGVLLFSLAILRTNVAPRWVAWLGVAVAVLGGWFTLLGPAGARYSNSSRSSASSASGSGWSR